MGMQAVNHANVMGCLDVFGDGGALHSRWFVHRDLTPTNILLSYATGLAKITDFGFSRTIGHRDRPLTPLCTTLWYRAPELLYGAKFYGQGVDIWSAGCIFCELFHRTPLFEGRSEFDMLTKIFEKRGTPTEHVWKDVSALPNFFEFSAHPKLAMTSLLPSASDQSRDLIDELLALDPKLRPSAEHALQSDCFTTAAPKVCCPMQLPFVRLGSAQR